MNNQPTAWMCPFGHINKWNKHICGCTHLQMTKLILDKKDYRGVKPYQYERLQR